MGDVICIDIFNFVIVYKYCRYGWTLTAGYTRTETLILIWRIPQYHRSNDECWQRHAILTLPHFNFKSLPQLYFIVSHNKADVMRVYQKVIDADPKFHAWNPKFSVCDPQFPEDFKDILQIKEVRKHHSASTYKDLNIAFINIFFNHPMLLYYTLWNLVCLFLLS